jgi:competence protein ComEC
LFSPGIASLFGHAIWPVVELIRMTIETVAPAKFSHLILVSPTVAAMVCYWCAAGAGLGAIHGSRRKAWLLCAAAMLALTVFLWRPLLPQPEVVFLDVGHGDSAFIRSREGKTLLVDGGDRRGRWDVGQRTVAPFLWSNHVRRLDYVAASHGDTDHIGGLEYVLRHFEVGTVLMSINDWQRPHEKAFMRLCADLGVPIRRLHAGETLDLGGTKVEVLHPPIADHESGDVNNNSLVLRLRWEGTTVLLPGDIEAPAEATVSRSECRAAVLKAPHHGSKTSSSAQFLDAVLPVECIVSTGGTRGHESLDEAVLARYVAHGMRVWRTDVLGGIRLIPRHGAVSVEAARPLRGYPRFLNAEDPLRDQAAATIR